MCLRSPCLARASRVAEEGGAGIGDRADRLFAIRLGYTRGMLTPDATHLSSALISRLARIATVAFAWAASAITGLAADPASAAAAAGEPLRSIAAILALPPAEIDAEPEAVVRGVVTTACAPAFVIENAGSAIFIAGFGHVIGGGVRSRRLRN